MGKKGNKKTRGTKTRKIGKKRKRVNWKFDRSLSLLGEKKTIVEKKISNRKNKDIEAILCRKIYVEDFPERVFSYLSIYFITLMLIFQLVKMSKIDSFLLFYYWLKLEKLMSLENFLKFSFVIFPINLFFTISFFVKKAKENSKTTIKTKKEKVILSFESEKNGN